LKRQNREAAAANSCRTQLTDEQMVILENTGTFVEPTASQLISNEPTPADAIPPLSALLRKKTAPLHKQIEALLRLRGGISTRADYREWLGRFLGLYDPLECALATFSGWDSLGLSMPSHGRAAAEIT
jgi:hypothetical protein